MAMMASASGQGTVDTYAAPGAYAAPPSPPSGAAYTSGVSVVSTGVDLSSKLQQIAAPLSIPFKVTAKAAAVGAAIPAAAAVKGAAVGSAIAGPIIAGAIAAPAVVAGKTAALFSLPMVIAQKLKDNAAAIQATGAKIISTKVAAIAAGATALKTGAIAVGTTLLKPVAVVKGAEAALLGSGLSLVGKKVGAIGAGITAVGTGVKNVGIGKVAVGAGLVGWGLDKSGTSVVAAPTPAPYASASYRRRRQATQAPNLSQAMNFIEMNKLQDCVARVICELNCNPDVEGANGRKVYGMLMKFQDTKEVDPNTLQYYKLAATHGIATKPNCDKCRTFYPNCKSSSRNLIHMAGRLNL